MIDELAVKANAKNSNWSSKIFDLEEKILFLFKNKD